MKNHTNICEKLEEFLYTHLITTYKSCKKHDCFVSDCILVEFSEEKNQFQGSLDRILSDFAGLRWWESDDKFADDFAKEQKISLNEVKGFIEDEMNEKLRTKVYAK